MKRKRQDLITGAAAVWLCCALAGCAIGPQATEPTSTYDLGAPRGHPQSGPRLEAVIYLPGIAAPAWLSGSGIVFRLAYENPARPQSYALSRWAAPPPELLTDRLRSRFAAAARGVVSRGDGVRADYQLRIELEEFSQSFDTPQSSKVALRARASLVSLANRSLVAQRAFVFERPAPSADAPGAVQALSAASEAFVESLLEWTQGRLAAAGGEPVK
jgi:cholesterol transport system auxiliary component